MKLGAENEDKGGTGNFNDRYSVKESRYDMTVPERILVVGK